MFQCAAFCLLRHRFCKEKWTIFNPLHWFFTLTHLVFVSYTCYPLFLGLCILQQIYIATDLVQDPIKMLSIAIA